MDEMDVEKYLLEEIKGLRKDVQSLTVQVAVLKTKAAVWGSVGGTLMGIAIMLIKEFLI